MPKKHLCFDSPAADGRVNTLDTYTTRESMIRETDWGRIVTLADPFGHGWCLLQFLRLGYDEIAETRSWVLSPDATR